MTVYNPPLQVHQFIATRAGDAERGPVVRLNAGEAAMRMISDGELVYLKGPRRQELVTVVVDDGIPRGAVVVRDVLGVTVTEIVRIVKLNLDEPEPRSGKHYA